MLLVSGHLDRNVMSRLWEITAVLEQGYFAPIIIFWGVGLLVFLH